MENIFIESTDLGLIAKIGYFHRHYKGHIACGFITWQSNVDIPELTCISYNHLGTKVIARATDRIRSGKMVAMYAEIRKTSDISTPCYWIRPLSMLMDDFDINGKLVLRFTNIGTILPKQAGFDDYSLVAPEKALSGN